MLLHQMSQNYILKYNNKINEIIKCISTSAPKFKGI